MYIRVTNKFKGSIKKENSNLNHSKLRIDESNLIQWKLSSNDYDQTFSFMELKIWRTFNWWTYLSH